MDRVCRLCRVLVVCLALPAPGVLAAVTWTLPDGQLATVQQCMAGSSPCSGLADGDTVVIPAGSWNWNDWVSVVKQVTVSGSGTLATTIVNTATRADSGTDHGLLALRVPDNGTFPSRITNLVLDSGTGSSSPTGFGYDLLIDAAATIAVHPKWRIDHNQFHIRRAHAIVTYKVGGVIDHNEMIHSSGSFFSVYGFTGSTVEPGQDLFADQAWADALSLGTANAYFIEDNHFHNATDGSFINTVHDGWKGERVVIRYNTLEDAVLGNHGTESSSRWRGGRAWEIYGNTATLHGALAWPSLWGARSGSGVVWGNTLSGGFSHVANLDDHRQTTADSPWLRCDGVNAWDSNEATTFLTGTHGGSNGVHVLTTSGLTGSAWVGYALHNLTAPRVSSGLITANTTTTITVAQDVYGTDPLTWNSGDSFAIHRPTVCFDQPTRGGGSLVRQNSNPPVLDGTGSAGWPGQTLEGAWAWNNTSTHGDNHLIATTYLPLLVEDRDYFNRAPQSGDSIYPYTPYIYPHPLASGASPPAAPPLFRIHQR